MMPGGKRMDKKEFLLEQWKMASELLRHMDDMIWRRFDYFVALNTALLTALGFLWANERPPLLRLFGSILIPAVGLALSRSWATMHKRAQLYHAIRGIQAKRAEQALITELNPDTPGQSRGKQPLAIFGVTPENYPDSYNEEMRHIPHSERGKGIRTLDIVFDIARGLGILWIVLFALCILVIFCRCCQSIATVTPCILALFC
jgi:hypothetical protein